MRTRGEVLSSAISFALIGAVKVVTDFGKASRTMRGTPSPTPRSHT